ncbi:Tyrosine--tRNA ligase [Euphorbia peplus]|nr:Tyrosine--tRNA ligase [Euphorbia peplus]
MSTVEDPKPPSEELQSLSINFNSNSTYASSPSTALQLTAKERFQIVRSIGEECIQEEELLNLLSKKAQPICYDGFEPSGRMHIAQGVMKTINVNKLTAAGCKVKILIADWFALLNNKMGGDLMKIQTVGHYLIEIWKAVGMDFEGDKVEFVWSSKEITSRASEYYPLVMDISRRNTIRRMMRCVQIMGRDEQDELTAAQLLYACMQCADIFFLKADICQMGMDQRKVNVLAREYCEDSGRKNKPIILSHHMLPGLHQGQEKMSE